MKSKWFLVKMISFFIGVLVICILITYISLGFSWKAKLILNVLFWALGVSVIFYIFFSRGEVGSAEMGFVTYFGELGRFVTSGPCLVLRWLAKLLIFPTKFFNLDITEKTFYSGHGVWKNADGEEEICEIEGLKVDIAVYFSFPREPERLKEAVKAGIPTEEKFLTKWIDDTIFGPTRIVISTMTYRDCISKSEEIQKQVLQKLKGGVFEAAGIKVLVPGEDVSDEFRPDSSVEPGAFFFEIKTMALQNKELEMRLSQRNIENIELAAAITDTQGKAIRSGGLYNRIIEKGLGLEEGNVGEKIMADEKLKLGLISTATETVRDQTAGEVGSFTRLSISGLKETGNIISEPVALYSALSKIGGLQKGMETPKKSEPKNVDEVADPGDTKETKKAEISPADQVSFKKRLEEIDALEKEAKKEKKAKKSERKAGYSEEEEKEPEIEDE